MGEEEKLQPTKIHIKCRRYDCKIKVKKHTEHTPFDENLYVQFSVDLMSIIDNYLNKIEKLEKKVN